MFPSYSARFQSNDCNKVFQYRIFRSSFSSYNENITAENDLVRCETNNENIYVMSYRMG